MRSGLLVQGPEARGRAVSEYSHARALSIAVRACKDRFPRCGGVMLWMGHDCFPCTANTSIVDFNGEPKPAALAVGEANSASLLSKERIRQATTPQTTLIDSLAGTAVDFGLGYMLGGDTSPLGSRRTTFGHDGAGGSLGLADPALHLSFGLVKNRMVSSVPGAATARRVLGEALTALGLTRQD